MKHLACTLALLFAGVIAAPTVADSIFAAHTILLADGTPAAEVPGASLSPADNAHPPGAGHGSPHHIEISPEVAERAGIRTHIAGAGNIARSVRAYGNVGVPPGHIAQVRARFPGLVRSVSVQLGEAVRKGDVLTTIESNDSLRSYPVHAPINGVVQMLNTTPGDLTTDTPLLTLLDDSTLSLELKIFPQQRAAVSAGQTVTIPRTQSLTQSQITHLIPVPGAPYVIARVPLDNSTGRFTPGDLIAADIVLERIDAAVVVDNRALQHVAGQDGVFIETDEGFVFQPLVLGQRDGQHTEVVRGLPADTRYVVENSYLLKADLEKAGATHEH